MQSFLNFTIFFVLSAFGLSAYFLNPYRAGSLFLGLALQLFAIVVLFLSTVSQKHAADRYTNAARDTAQANRRWLIGSLAAVCIAGGLLIAGVPSRILRVILFFTLWAGAVGAGQYLCYFVWKRDKNELVSKLAAEGIVLRAREKETKRQAKEAAAQKEKEAREQAKRTAAAQKAQAAQSSNASQNLEIPESMPYSMARERLGDPPDLLLAIRLQSGDESALSEALSHPTRAALAAVQSEIAHCYGSSAVIFYRSGGLTAHMSSSMEEAHNTLLALAKAHKLCVNPCWTQSLIASLGLRSSLLMQDLVGSCAGRDVFAYQLLGVELQLAGRLGIAGINREG